MKKFTQKLLDNFDSSKENYHQQILDVAYDAWTTDMEWTYADMIDNTIEQFGQLTALLVLVGKFNQQVTNGGHIQYIMNDFASRGSKYDLDIHNKMISLMSSTYLKPCDNYDMILKIMRSLDVVYYPSEYETETCSSCGGSGMSDYGEEDEECDDCCGTGEIEFLNDEEFVHNGEHLDEQYYEVYEDWLQSIEKLLHHMPELNGENHE